MVKNKVNVANIKREISPDLGVDSILPYVFYWTLGGFGRCNIHCATLVLVVNFVAFFRLKHLCRVTVIRNNTLPTHHVMMYVGLMSHTHTHTHTHTCVHTIPLSENASTAFGLKRASHNGCVQARA